MAQVFLSLGSNVGDREDHLKSAVSELQSLGNVAAVSRMYETEPFGKKDQSWFANMCVHLDTAALPEILFEQCQQIERDHGRLRREKWGPRPLDIDILFYGNRIVQTPALAIPHPGIPQRRFVLIPLADIAADYTHPGFKKSIRELLKECMDSSIVKLGFVHNRQSRIPRLPRGAAVRLQAPPTHHDHP